MKPKKTKRRIQLTMLILLLCNVIFAQEVKQLPIDSLNKAVVGLQSYVEQLKKIKISGYLQPQFQYCDSTEIKSYAGGDFPANSDKRFALRRARLKVVYTGNLSEYVFQIDATEKGLTIKDMYAKFTEPWLKTFSLTMGMQNRPFGFEVGYSSSLRESPERARMSQIIFSNERDMGAMLTFQLPKTSPLNILKLDVGVFNGTGAPSADSATTDFDKFKDLIGHLTINKTRKDEKFNIGAGVSYYNGGFRNGSKFIYTDYVQGDTLKTFICDSTATNLGQMIRREYVGADLQLNMKLPWGLTVIRAEYIKGRQPGSSSSTKSINTSIQPNGSVYYRHFNGAYFYFVQDIAKTKFQLIAKYDWYDPNTKVSGKEIGTAGSKLSTADIKYNTTGVGFAYKMDKNIKFTVYYDMVKNENTLCSGYTKDVPDNVWTVRMQYKF